MARLTPNQADRQNAVAAAQRKLNSGQTLTSAERVILGMSAIPPSPTTSNFDPNLGSTISKKPSPTVAAPTPVSSTPAVDQGAIDRAVQAERDRLAKIEKDRLAAIEQEFLRQMQKSTLEAIAKMPKPLLSVPKEPVKYANPGDIVEDINDLPIDLILKLTLEKIGGMELLSLVRHDTVNGQNIAYRPIKNISQLAIEYNSQNLVKMPNSSDSYFKNFPIKLEGHLPQTTNELPPLVVYIDPVTENVIIDLVDLKGDYEIEVQMVSSGKVFDDTIYTEDYS